MTDICFSFYNRGLLPFSVGLFKAPYPLGFKFNIYHVGNISKMPEFRALWPSVLKFQPLALLFICILFVLLVLFVVVLSV